MTPHGASPARRQRGLWLARELPFPLDTGDRIYSGQLMRALADAGVDLTVTGFPSADGAVPPADWPVAWRTVPGARRGTLRALCSAMPLVAAAHATAAYRRLVAALAREPWDFVVIDQYGMGWAVPVFRRRPSGGTRPVLVHVAHDHEASVYASLVRGYSGPAAKRLGLWQNWHKTRWFERRIARSVDLVTAITEEDATRFAADAPATPRVVLTPGYAGATASRTRIDAAVPRNVVMVGSYRWVAKQENLRRFVAVADPVFAEQGIQLHVIGAMPGELAAQLRASKRCVQVHGFVDDIAAHFANARIAVVPEEIGGGFKLKFLDYIFGGVPVATLTHAAAGLPGDVRRALICADTLDGLVQKVAAAIDDVDALDAMQRAALAAAQKQFQWSDRGRAMLAAITQCGKRAAARPGLHTPSLSSE